MRQRNVLRPGTELRQWVQPQRPKAVIGPIAQRGQAAGREGTARVTGGACVQRASTAAIAARSKGLAK